MQRRIMLDTETLGVKPGCPVLSIGAVEFTETAITGSFYTTVSLKDSMRLGLKPEADTILWWLGQERAAQDKLTDPSAPLVSDALAALNYTFEWQDTEIWANGAAFDLPILEALYAVAGKPHPWAFYNVRCMRTLRALCPDVPRPKPALAHDALEDARAQALYVQQMLTSLKTPAVMAHAC